ncbi:MAG: hypothetical protein ACK5NB_09890 [Flavobacteriaceae bacterium]
MKYVLGFIVSVICLFLFSYFLLQIWDINMIDKNNLGKLSWSVGLTVLGSIVFVLLYGFFFKNPAKGYENSDTVVQRKRTN